MKLISIASSTALLIFLAACGGGGDDAAAPAPAANAATSTQTPNAIALKYAGTWVGGCEQTSTTSSAKNTVVITQTTVAGFNISETDTNFTGTSCAGAGTAKPVNLFAVTFDGTKTIGTDTVDKITAAQTGQPVQKQVVLIKGTAPAVLFFGKSASDGGAVDAQGYPTTLEATGNTKQ
jgi:hypothetical protein